VGATIGGWVYETYGPRMMFGGMGVVVLCTMVLFFFSDRESAGRELRDTLGRWWRARQDRARRSASSSVAYGDNDDDEAATMSSLAYSRLDALDDVNSDDGVSS
jgi:hypothetical protein